jgi:SAM-dependent methyltransferase
MQGDYAQQYGELQQWHWWFRGRRRVIESILRYEVDSAPSLKILSVGCGPAEALKWLFPFAGPKGRVVGLDRDPIHGRRLPDYSEFIIGTLESAPLADASFDVVLALDVFEHLDDDLSGLREAARIVKPGGLLLITVPALPSLWGGQDVVSEHRRRYTRHSLSHLFREAGLSNYRLQYFNTFLFPLAALVRLNRRAMGLGNRPRSDAEDNHPGLINDALAWIFGAESYFINYAPAPIGVSLVARYRPPNR